MAMLRRAFSIIISCVAPVAAHSQSLLISEYIEGTSFNKAVEVLNTTASPIDLASVGATLQLYANGSATATATMALSGTLAAGDVFVVSHASASATILAQTDVTNSTLANFNGDDAVVLRTGGPTGTVIDIIGQVGFDPGTEWGTGLASTADNTLVRKPAACTGDSNPSDAFDPAVDYDGFATDTFTDLGIYGGTCVAGGAQTTVQFAGPTAAAGEGDGTVALQITITNPHVSVATTFDVVFLSADPGTTGTGPDIGGFTTVPVVAPAGATSASVTVTISDDPDPEPTEDFVFEIQNVAGGTNATVGTQATTTLSIADNDTPVADFVVINEVDSDTPGVDAAEFVELYDGGAGSTDLDGLSLVFFNGTNNTSYAAFDLDGFSTDANGLFVAGNAGVPGVQVVFAGNLLQNGPDAVALYAADATAFPNGTAATTVNLIDAFVYGTDDARDTDLLAALGQTVQYEEAYEGAADGLAPQRLNAPLGEGLLGGGTPTYSGLYYALAPSPNAVNPPVLLVDETAEVADLPGWRLLSTPVVGTDQAFLSVADYAPINLIQGVPAGAVNGGQYPAAGDNLLSTYNGDGTFSGPTDTDVQLPPGEGFFWYWYDQDIIPGDPSGTSRSYDLANPEFEFALTGIPVDDHLNNVPYGAPLARTADGFYMVGNPFAYSYRLGGFQVDDGLLSSNFYAYDPAIGTYIVLVADFGNPFAGNAVPVWNGVMAEVQDVTPSIPFVAFTTSSAFVDPVVDDTFVGLVAGGGGAEARLGLLLDRVTDAGDVPVDRAAMLRFREDAVTEWDQHDGSKPIPPATTALVAPMGSRDGETVRQAVRSLPLAFGARLDVPLAFIAAEAGLYRLGVDLAAYPTEWSVRLSDLATGEMVDLRAGPYAFEASAADWSERFVLTVASTVTSDAPGANEVYVSVVTPNPVSGQATLSLRTPAAQHVRADIFDALGRRVATILDADMAPGEAREVAIDAGRLAPGTYVVRVSGETFVEVRRVVVRR